MTSPVWSQCRQPGEGQHDITSYLSPFEPQSSTKRSDTTPPFCSHNCGWNLEWFCCCCCPIICASRRGVAPTPLVASLAPCHIPDSFGIAGLLPEVHSRGDIVGRLPSAGDTALLPSHFSVHYCLLCFNLCRTLPTLPAVAAAADDDRFYIALFSALEQTDCARMWFYMSE